MTVTLQEYFNKPPLGVPSFLRDLKPTSSGSSVFQPLLAHRRQKDEYTLVHAVPPSQARDAVPTVSYIDDFLTEEECQAVVQLFKDVNTNKHKSPLVCFARNKQLNTLLKKNILNTPTISLKDGESESQECLNATDKLMKHLSYSSSAFIAPSRHSLIDEINERIERVFGLPKKQGASSQILKYTKNQEYLPHTDCTLDIHPNDRAVTVLIYLNDLEVKQGGATVFTKLGEKVTPKVEKIYVNIEQQHQQPITKNNDNNNN